MPLKKKKKPSLAKLKKKAWDLLSLIVRQRAANSNGTVVCYTCGVVSHWRNMHAGHAIGGRHGAVLLDESIIRCQCPRCNIFLRGQYGIFALKLINEHSADWYEKKQIDSHKIVKWTTSDLQERIQGYEKRLKQIEI